MAKFLTDELASYIAKKQAIFIAGAGITISATDELTVVILRPLAVPKQGRSSRRARQEIRLGDIHK